MSEETKAADRSAPIGIIMAIGTSAVVGWGYIMALLFSIQVRLIWLATPRGTKQKPV
jgi:amino acid transporter